MDREFKPAFSLTSSSGWLAWGLWEYDLSAHGPGVFWWRKQEVNFGGDGLIRVVKEQEAGKDLGRGFMWLVVIVKNPI